jgi:hypothetical protein
MDPFWDQHGSEIQVCSNVADLLPLLFVDKKKYWQNILTNWKDKCQNLEKRVSSGSGVKSTSLKSQKKGILVREDAFYLFLTTIACIQFENYFKLVWSVFWIRILIHADPYWFGILDPDLFWVGFPRSGSRRAKIFSQKGIKWINFSFWRFFIFFLMVDILWFEPESPSWRSKWQYVTKTANLFKK